MTVQNNRTRSFAASVAILLISATSSSAQEASDVAERLRDFMARQNWEFTWTDVTGDASRMTLQDATIRTIGGKDSQLLGDVVLSGATLQDDSLRVEELKMAGFSFVADEAEIVVGPMTFTGLLLPSDENDAKNLANMFYDSSTLESLTVRSGNEQIFSLTNAAGKMKAPQDGSPIEYSSSVEKFSTNLSFVTEPAAKAYIQALGLEQLDGRIRLEGYWQPTDGSISISDYDITIDNAGTLSFTLDMGGFTPAFIEQVGEFSRQMDAAGVDFSAPQRRMAMIGMYSSLILKGASLKFDDASFTRRVIEVVATQQGVQPEDFTNMIKGSVPMGLAQMGLAGISAAIVPAVNSFLDNPQNIEISVKPKNPISFAAIGQTSQTMPKNRAAAVQELIDLLGITVSANR